MQFTDFQKEIIKAIAANNINDFRTMAETLFGNYEVDGAGTSTEIIDVKVGTSNDSLSQMQMKLLDYHYVYTKLDKLSLIQIVNVGSQATGEFRVLNNPNRSLTGPDTTSGNIVADLRKKIILPSGELKKFIEDGFKTKEEVYQERLIQQQKESMKVTRRIAYISIGASVVISILTFLFSVIFTPGRKVEITNPGAFSNEMKVIIEKENIKQKKGIK